MNRKPIGISVPYRAQNKKQPKNWNGISDGEIIETLRDYNMEPSPHRMNFTKEIIRKLMERNT